MSLEKALGVHAPALILKGRRNEILASNLANADTPNYKARDIDFKAALKRFVDEKGAGSQTLKVTHPNHISSSADTFMGEELQYRVPNQPSLDGNTVDTQVEKAQFTQNALEYQTSFRFLNGRITGLISTLRGE